VFIKRAAYFTKNMFSIPAFISRDKRRSFEKIIVFHNVYQNLCQIVPLFFDYPLLCREYVSTEIFYRSILNKRTFKIKNPPFWNIFNSRMDLKSGAVFKKLLKLQRGGHGKQHK